MRMHPIATQLFLLAALASGSIGQVFAADAGTLLVLNKSDDTVSLVDPVSKQMVTTLATGAAPHEVAISPDGRIAVISNYGHTRDGNTLSVIDIAARKTLRTIDLDQHRRPHGIAWLKANQVVVTTEGSQSLLMVDIETARIVGSVATGQHVSHMVALAPKHERAFVANIGSGSVSVIDLESKRRIANIPTGAGAEGIDVSPDQSEVWVVNRGADTISVIDTTSSQVSATLPSKAFPIRVKFTPDGKYALVSNARSGDVAVFDTKARHEIRRIPMQVRPREPQVDALRMSNQLGTGPVPVGILIVPTLNRAYVANSNADILSVIDLDTWRIVDHLTAGKEPDGLGYTPISAR